ncbi:MAG: amidohydrolase family protein [Bacteroidales bacterium]
MNRLASSLGLALLSIAATAQIRVRPVAEPGFEQRIAEHIGRMQIVDTHEHIVNPATVDPASLDFRLLISHYAPGDYRSAGMPWETWDRMATDTLSDLQKWQILKPYWDLSSNTAYNRAALLSANLFGIQTIDETTVEELSIRIREAYQGDWVDYVLREKCRIRYVIEDYPFEDEDHRVFGDPEMFRYVRRFDSFILIHSPADIQGNDRWAKGGISSLDDLVDALEKAFLSARDEGIVAVKTLLAYNRTLAYGNVTKEEAGKAFARILGLPGDERLAFSEVKPLQDYMMHRVLDLAGKHRLPVQIHTGLNGGDIENANPVHLINLFRTYPDVNFILFHGGYPYGGELAVLAKKFRNVHIDMCWLYIISPSYAGRYLSEWLETVPAGKIMAFGGDFLHVEGVYGHLMLARQVIAKVLSDKVRSGYFSEEEAIHVANLILHDNAVRILGLDL